MLQLGSALIVATASVDGEPRAGRASGWTVVDPDTPRVRIAVTADDPVVVDNLRLDGYVSVTGADVATLRSVQLKGRLVGVDEPTTADLDLIARHTDVFVSTIQVTDGHPSDVVRRFLPITHVMIEIVVEEIYDQTPGPEAGSVLRLERS